ncbi:hypothetical protein EDB85DRAFT_2277913 [Lactarius pseudohatsudake]|nr:hypothetical protein EDB85DRAFT_2277913 [Lactarius pseudohatsudake]
MNFIFPRHRTRSRPLILVCQGHLNSSPNSHRLVVFGPVPVETFLLPASGLWVFLISALRPSNTWHPAGSAHHYWCQSSAPRFTRNGQPDPLTWSWCLVGRARSVCETRRREGAACCTQLACALHTSSRVELKVAVTPEKFIGTSRLTATIGDDKNSLQTPVPVLADDGEREETQFHEWGVCATVLWPATKLIDEDDHPNASGFRFMEVHHNPAILPAIVIFKKRYDKTTYQQVSPSSGQDDSQTTAHAKTDDIPEIFPCDAHPLPLRTLCRWQIPQVAIYAETL